MLQPKAILLLLVSAMLFMSTLQGQVSNGEQGWQLNYRDTTAILKNITKAGKLLEQGGIHRIEALKMFRALKEESNTLGFHRGVIQSLMGIGACYYNNSDYEKAIEQAEEALKYAAQAGNDDYYGLIESNIGITYAANKDNIEAISHFHKALRYYENQDTLSPTGSGNLQVSIAALLLDMRRDSSALFYLDKAAIIAEEEKDDPLRCMVYMHKARAIYANSPILRSCHSDTIPCLHPGLFRGTHIHLQYH